MAIFFNVVNFDPDASTFYLGGVKPYLRLRHSIFDEEREGWQAVILTYANLIDCVLVAALCVLFFARGKHSLPSPADGTTDKLLPGQFLLFGFFYTQIEIMEVIILFLSGLQCTLLLSLWSRFFIFWKVIQMMWKTYFFYFLVMSPLFFGCCAMASGIYGGHLAEFRSYTVSGITMDVSELKSTKLK